jgi:uncharacterized protein YqgV (UPF0045/DUF77 family)
MQWPERQRGLKVENFYPRPQGAPRNGPPMIIQAEISLYPLRESDVVPAIYDFVRRLEQAGLQVEVGAMSSLVSGESALVFSALREAYEAACLGGSRVLVVKVRNSSPPTPA